MKHLLNYSQNFATQFKMQECFSVNNLESLVHMVLASPPAKKGYSTDRRSAISQTLQIHTLRFTTTKYLNAYSFEIRNLSEGLQLFGQVLPSSTDTFHTHSALCSGEESPPGHGVSFCALFKYFKVLSFPLA